jgi:dCMP deaminase
MKEKEITAHMKAAYVYAELSYCKRRQVGCVLVKDGSIIAIGYNGTPPGEDNDCEDCNGMTKSSVTHAEDNALRKLIRRNESSIGCSVFTTTAPCESCAEKLISAGVAHIYFAEYYKNKKGIQYLLDREFLVTQVNIK